MTPRTEVDEVDLNDEPKTIRATLAKSPHSRLPVTDGDRDRPIGILQAKDLLDSYLREERPDLRSHVREAPIIPASVDARDALAILKSSPQLEDDANGHRSYQYRQGRVGCWYHSGRYASMLVCTRRARVGSTCCRFHFLDAFHQANLRY